jgi:hypothetical protein
MQTASSEGDSTMATKTTTDHPPIVAAGEWQAARDKLLVKKGR